MEQVWYEFSGGLILTIVHENKDWVCADFEKWKKKPHYVESQER